jgi:16S rRNA U516 pseudouridylate synthase RsuA-like enzyme
MKKQAQEEKIRINKFLAMCGVASRRAADQMVLEGRVTVNGQLVVEPGSRVDPRKDEVIVDGKRMAEPENKKVYILFNKPRNVITTSHDERDRQQILDFIDVPERVFPVAPAFCC